ncbi:MAG TPA: serine/threonine-protein kinase, partial [Gemmatimonadales bacterium]|nr:serine/threonine-protein kinase [Gemmatimonadales bacterium]
MNTRTGQALPAVPTKGMGRYSLKKIAGKGGMGEVWLAEDTDIGRTVALKRMLKARSRQRDQFLHEAQVTGQLEHPGIIPVHELTRDENGEPFYTMKFVHGQTLKEVIADYHAGKTKIAEPVGATAKNGATSDPKSGAASREVEWLRLLNIFLDLCQTMAYAHSKRVIHRDIKPENVMVGAYGETLVLDWGLAKVVGTPDSPDTSEEGIRQSASVLGTVAGTVKGSPFYFAPEVAAGKVNEVDMVSDVYLLGGTLYQILTGHSPREATTITELIDMAKNKQPEAPRKLDPTIPKPLQAICMKALALRKEDRYQSAAALAEDMQRYLAGEPVTAYQENAWERAWRWIKRHRRTLGQAAAAVAFVSLALTAFFMIRAADLRRQESDRVAAKLRNEKRAEQEIETFTKVAEEARYFAANADDDTASALSTEPAKAATKIEEALALADRWGPELLEMPLEEERPRLRQDIYDLLLELAQLKSRPASKDEVRAVKTILDRAATLGNPTRGFYRLRAQTLETLGQGSADDDRKRAEDPDTPTTA